MMTNLNGSTLILLRNVLNLSFVNMFSIGIALYIYGPIPHKLDQSKLDEYSNIGSCNKKKSKIELLSYIKLQN